MAVYIGRWDCTSCGYKGVKGPETECPNCAADRPKNVKFYMADDKDIVQDPSVLLRAKAGADWRCSYCGQNNPSTKSICKDCGNPKSLTDKKLEIKEYTTQHIPRSGDGTREKVTAQPTQTTPKKFNKKGCFIGLAVVVILIIALSWSNDIYVTVEEFEWKRTITVEENRKVIEEGWNLPNSAQLISSGQAIHHYDQVLDHYETRTRTQQRATGTEEYVCGKRDLGNGYFEDKYCTRTIYESYEEEYQEPIYRKEPVYQTKYRYSIYRWLPTNAIITSGNDHAPEWGNTTTITTQKSFREAGRIGIYTIHVRDEKNEIHEHNISESEWERLEIGTQLKGQRGVLTGRYRGLDDERVHELE